MLQILWETLLAACSLLSAQHSCPVWRCQRAQQGLPAPHGAWLQWVGPWGSPEPLCGGEGKGFTVGKGTHSPHCPSIPCLELLGVMPPDILERTLPVEGRWPCPLLMDTSVASCPHEEVPVLWA